jgi:hypothetical protein
MGSSEGISPVSGVFFASRDCAFFLAPRDSLPVIPAFAGRPRGAYRPPGANFSRAHLSPLYLPPTYLHPSPAAEGGFRKRLKRAGDGASPFEPLGAALSSRASMPLHARSIRGRALFRVSVRGDPAGARPSASKTLIRCAAISKPPSSPDHDAASDFLKPGKTPARAPKGCPIDNQDRSVSPPALPRTLFAPGDSAFRSRPPGDAFLVCALRRASGEPAAGRGRSPGGRLPAGESPGANKIRSVA